MTHSIDWAHIAHQIRNATQTDFTFRDATPLAGGDSHQAWHLTGTDTPSVPLADRHYFVKLNSLAAMSIFSAERTGLSAIAASHTIRVPRVITHGQTSQHSFLVLEHLDLNTRGDSGLLGRQLAAMHRHHAHQFGWDQNNTIGVTPQLNNWSADWSSFWKEQRLSFQLELAARHGYRGKLQELGRSVLDALPDLLAGHQPVPSLLHGDLWAGNHGFLSDGSPVLFDPATYYGDRETDMAMTELFGGYDAEFYAAYQAAYPLDAGYNRRKTLYNLYHILNHCNMVSASYVAQAERMMRGLLKDMG